MVKGQRPGQLLLRENADFSRIVPGAQVSFSPANENRRYGVKTRVPTGTGVCVKLLQVSDR